MERLVKEQKAMQRKNEDRLSHSGKETLSREDSHSRSFAQNIQVVGLDHKIFFSFSVGTGVSPESCDAELDSIYARIKELEESIVSLGMYFRVLEKVANMIFCLDFELDDYEMIKMREKTNKVKRRMSEAVGGEVAVNLDTVDMFLRNNNLWEEYKSGDRKMF